MYARRAPAALLALTLLALTLLAAPLAAAIPAPAVPPVEPPAALHADDTQDLRDLAQLARADRSHRNAVEQLAVTPPPPVVKTPTRAATVKAPTRNRTRPPRTEARPVPAPVGSLAAVIAFALAQAGEPYRWGAAGPSAWDCSGLIMMAFRQIGVSLPHQSGGIAARGRVVPRSQLRPGDTLHWSGHVALALDNNRMIHASRAGQPVKVATIYGSPRVVRIVG